MAEVYRAAVIGTGRIAGSIDDEVRGVPGMIFPYSHAGTYETCERTTIVAAADVLPDKLQEFCTRWEVPHAYSDYRELIERERPDIISVTTRPAAHRDIVVFAAEHGVRAIWCEKPLCCSMAEADEMVAACQQHGVKFNLGANRRYGPFYHQVRTLIESGAIGELRSVACYAAGSLLWSHSHATDLLLLLAGDPAVEYVQGTTSTALDDYADNRLDADPSLYSAYIHFAGGVHGYMLATLGYDWEVTGSTGKIRINNDGREVELRQQAGQWKQLTVQPTPELARGSGALSCLEDLIEALDTGRETTGPIDLARRSQELLMGIITSHGQGGARVTLPLADRTLYVGKPDW
ncbi:MAG: Gfo/Idh/MocA family protein [Thermomicrobiales bacterium]